eukprot:g42382.t1
MNKRGEMKETVLDTKATVNQVWHQGTLAKPESMGIKGKALRWLESHLAQRKMPELLESTGYRLVRLACGIDFQPLILLQYLNNPLLLIGQHDNFTFKAAWHSIPISNVRESRDKTPGDLTTLLLLRNIGFAVSDIL